MELLITPNFNYFFFFLNIKAIHPYLSSVLLNFDCSID